MKTTHFLLAPAFATMAFIFFACSSTDFLEYGGQTYKTVKINSQTWMAENLNYEAENSRCYDNNPDNCAKYGRLYKWETAMNVCPKGWHLPNNEDWNKLLRFVDGDTTSENLYESPTAGKHLKAAKGWNDGGNGTDYYGFSALPGGTGFSDGSFSRAGFYGRWCSASEQDSTNAYLRLMGHIHDYAFWHIYDKSLLFSVRCLQD